MSYIRLGEQKRSMALGSSVAPRSSPTEVEGLSGEPPRVFQRRLSTPMTGGRRPIPGDGIITTLVQPWWRELEW